MSQTGWFPRYSPDNDRLTWERPNYWQAQWVNGTAEIAHNGVNVLIGGVSTSALAPNELSAGGDRWAGFRPDPVRVYTSWGLTLLGAGCPTVNPDGLFGYVDDRQAAMKNLIFNDRHVSHGAITDVRASRQALVWSAAGKTWGMRLDVPDAASYIQAAPEEFRPIPIDTPDGPWVGNHTHAGLVLRPFAETRGYRFDNGGQAFGADWKYRAGSIVAIFTNDAGVQSTQTFDLRAARVELGSLEPAPPQPPVPPQPPTPEPPPMATVPNRASELDAFWFRWNAHQSITDEAEKHRFTAAFMAELNTLDGSGRWGRKARPGTNAISKDTAGYWLGTAIPTSPTDGKIHAFDLISGGDGSVHWDKAAEQGDPLYNNIDARWFPVSAAAPAPGPTPPPQPGPDLTSRVAELERLRVEDRQAAKDALQAVSDALQREIDAISPTRDPATLRAAVEAILSGYEVNGSTGRNLAHAHSLKLNLQRKP